MIDSVRQSECIGVRKLLVSVSALGLSAATLAGPPASAVTLFGHGDFDGVLYSIDTDTMVVTGLNAPNTERDCCGPEIQISPNGSTIYWSTTDFDDFPQSLVSIDPVTGLTTDSLMLSGHPLDEIGNLTDTLTALEFVGNTLYGSAHDAGPETRPGVLVTVDLATGAMTEIGHMTGMNRPTGGMAWTGQTMYAVTATNNNDSSLFTIDLATGEATLVTPLTIGGAATDTVTGLAYVDGVMYAVTNRGTNDLYSIDLATGEMTALFNMGLSVNSLTALFGTPQETVNLFDQQHALSPAVMNHQAAAMSSGIQTVVLGRLGTLDSTTQVGATNHVQFASLNPAAHARPGEGNSAELAAAGGSSMAPASPWGVWIKGQGTGYDGEGSSFDGTTFDFLGGVDRRIGAKVLVGVLAGYGTANFDTRASGIDGEFDASGFHVGVYGGVAVTHNIYLDVLAAYSRLDYDTASGSTTGSFDADRGTVAANITARFPMGRVIVEPAAGITFSSERQDSYTDSASFRHDEETINAGRISVGPRVIMPVSLQSMELMPWAAVKAEYEFSNQDASANSGLPDIDGALSARLSAGVEATAGPNMNIGIRGDVSGLGSDEYLGYGGALTFRMAF